MRPSQLNRCRSRLGAPAVHRICIWSQHLPAACIAIVLVATGPLVDTSLGDALFERQLIVDRSANIFETDTFDLDIIVSPSFFSSEEAITLFDEATIHPGSNGLVLYADAENQADYAAAAQQLSDSLDEYIRVRLAEVSSGRAEQRGWSESHFFLGLSEPGRPDLAGRRIDGFRLTIDRFVLESDRGLRGDPPVQLIATFSVLGAVPEPTSAALLAATLMGLRGACRRGFDV